MDFQINQAFRPFTLCHCRRGPDCHIAGIGRDGDSTVQANQGGRGLRQQPSRPPQLAPIVIDKLDFAIQGEGKGTEVVAVVFRDLGTFGRDRRLKVGPAALCRFTKQLPDPRFKPAPVEFRRRIVDSSGVRMGHREPCFGQ